MPAVTPTTPPDDIQATGSWPSYKKPINQFATDANNAMVQLPDIFEGINEHTSYQNEAAQATQQNAQFATEEADRATGQANDAADSAIAAAGAANFVGLWSAQTGAFAKNQSVDYGTPSRRWRSVVDIPNVAASVPSESNSDWSLELGTAAKRDVVDSGEDDSRSGDIASVDYLANLSTTVQENLFINSHDISEGGWGMTGGTSTASEFSESDDASAAVHYFQQLRNITLYDGEWFVNTFKLAPRGRRYIRVHMYYGVDAPNTIFDLQEGTVVSPYPGVPSWCFKRIEEGKEWTYCCIAGKVTTPTENRVLGRIVIYNEDGSSQSYQGDGRVAVDFGGASLARAQFPIEIIKTTDSAILRDDDPVHRSQLDAAVATADAIRYIGTQTYTSADEDGSGNIDIPVDFSEKNWVNVDCSDASITETGGFDLDITGLQTAKPATYTIHIKGGAVKNDVFYTLPAGWSLHWHATPEYTNTGGTTAAKRAGHTYITLQTDPLAGQNVNGSYGDSRYYT